MPSEQVERAANTLFDDYVLGDWDAIETIDNTLEASDRWQDVIEAMRAAYLKQGESRDDKAKRVLRAYEKAMDDLCERIADGEVKV